MSGTGFLGLREMALRNLSELVEDLAQQSRLGSGILLSQNVLTSFDR